LARFVERITSEALNKSVENEMSISQMFLDHAFDGIAPAFPDMMIRGRPDQRLEILRTQSDDEQGPWQQLEHSATVVPASI
jgi:hypothetical protein